MRAAYLTGPRKLRVERVDAPECPPDGLLLRVEACGICGSDLRRWREGPPAGASAINPGHEVGGTVVAVGPDVAPGYAPGDRLALAPDVHCDRCFFCRHGRYNLCDDMVMVGITPGLPGGLSEMMPLDGAILQRGIVHHMPEGLSFAEGALAEPLSSVVASHEKLGTSLADTVVVIGAGPIGCMHIAVAKARGARVIVSQRSETRRRLAERFDPDVVVDPTSEDLVQVVGDYTEGRGAEIAVCANPVAATQRQAVELVRKGGRVVLFGGLPKADPMTTLDANRIHYGEIEVWGAFSYHPTHHAQALDLLARGIVDADALVTHSYPLDQVQEAFETADSGQGLKVMVLPGGGSGEE